MLLFCSHVSIASHKPCYSRRSEVTSSFTLQADFQFFTSALDLVYFPLLPSPCIFRSLSLLEQPLLSELLWGGILITRISHASLPQSLSLRQGKFLRCQSKWMLKKSLLKGYGCLYSTQVRKGCQHGFWHKKQAATWQNSALSHRLQHLPLFPRSCCH